MYDIRNRNDESDDEFTNSSSILDSNTSNKLIEDKIAPEVLSNIEAIQDVPDFEETDEIKLMVNTQEDLKPHTIYLLKTVNKLDQNIEWLNKVTLDNNRQARKTNGNVIILKEWHNMYGHKTVEALKKVEKHEHLLENALTIKTAFKYVATSIISIISGLFLGAEFFSKLFR